MHSNKLYIVGNGFDLWHGIPSSYIQFKEYVRLHDRDLFDAIENYLHADEDWSDLESALANIDVDSIIDDLGHFMPSYGAEDWSDSGHHDFQYEVEKLVQRLSAELKACFGEWIRTLVIPTASTATKFLRGIDVNAIFLTFNYTSTLGDLYAVPNTRVLHIHGDAREQDRELILGHAWNPTQRQSLNDRLDIEDIDTRLIEAHDILDDYFSRTFKPSEQLIRENQAFFDQLGAIKTVFVLGHSLSYVDSQYIQALLRVPSIAAAHWYVACRSEHERPTKFDLLVAQGIDVQQASTVLWADI
ncbi:bacteriophage abortive infection AbiH family protein [Achromobacter sp. ACM04]|uniref:bacteriophage abortive infection AbiH family protein n=1 Tax=Achromobacter sp. ACM04 TaxID=2769312 RepID=UPI001786B6F9|nr:bacteriophage abortive infection AbiH family protein [Achromobacter sp. ACM04]MBD9423087.1 bacteriophage abortive infection AbiH family protein [Achromobacter sp. ACM04]